MEAYHIISNISPCLKINGQYSVCIMKIFSHNLEITVLNFVRLNAYYIV